ncbi:MAG TPA: hypothetical protein VG889_09815 [Rhizomicrobium sp.]|nr:hypothetical protein [Rhizomicrobium sp.]
MPTIKIMYWNVQDLGTDQPLRRGANFQPICDFMAGFAALCQVDIICLMESRENFVNYLGPLRTALDAAFATAGLVHNWRYDWIPGSIRGTLETRFAEDDLADRPSKRLKLVVDHREAGRVRPTRFEQLGYTETGHREGYVILWNNAATGFTMMQRATGPSGGVNTALNGLHRQANHAINLVFDGREIDGWVQVGNAQLGHWLLTASAPVGATSWTLLDFAQRAGTAGNWYAVRRPAYCTIQVNAPGPVTNRMMSIVVCHAPSSESGGAFGTTNRCSLSRQMYQAQAMNNQWFNAAWTVAGGDFNVSTQHDYAYVYDSFTTALGPTHTAGAGCAQFVPARTGTANEALSKSIVRLQKSRPGGFGRFDLIPILPVPPAPDTNALYRSLAVDNIFTRNLTTAPEQADYQVYDVPEQLETNHSPVAQLANTAFHGFIAGAVAGFAADLAGNPVHPNGDMVYSNILDYPQLMAQLGAEHFTVPRRAAEFTNTFLSDHLPLVVSVTT